MRLHRLIAILLLIESRGQIKAKELASALETSLRTIYRDIEILCQAGIPIAAATGPRGGIYFMEGYSARLYDLGHDDAVNLYLTGATMHMGDSGSDLRNTLLKLEKLLPAGYGKDIRTAKERFYFDENPWWHRRRDVQCLEVLRKAVWNSKKVRVTYRKANGEISERELLPYGLVVKDGEWYLAAFCQMGGQVKTYRCERIAKACLLDGAFEPPSAFDLESYWKESGKRFRKKCSDNEQYPVMIKLHKSEAGLLNRLEVYDASEEDDYILAKINMHKYEFACREVEGILWQAEILSPEELRNHIKQKVEDLFRKYEHNKDLEL